MVNNNNKLIKCVAKKSKIKMDEKKVSSKFNFLKLFNLYWYI